ncbi:MAG: pyridoxal 5'-phosphate synthase glutaminase subunit PdxT [archaeon]
MRIGVLALQGDVIEHKSVLRSLGMEPIEIRTPEDLEGISGLILPGGESTTIGKLMRRVNLDTTIKRLVREGMPIFGTCAGMILLAKEIEGEEKSHLGLIDITVRRNDYGRQLDSFETNVKTSISSKPIHVAFIRAPVMTRHDKDVEVLATHSGHVVLARQRNVLVASFHAEITDETAVHEYFIRMLKGDDP